MYHNIQKVSSSMFAGYLDRPPQLKITDPASSVKDVAPTKPAPNSITFHRHGNELAIRTPWQQCQFTYKSKVKSSQKVKLYTLYNRKCLTQSITYVRSKGMQYSVGSIYGSPSTYSTCTICMRHSSRHW